jgi:hypothetical protein
MDSEKESENSFNQRLATDKNQIKYWDADGGVVGYVVII